MMIEKTTDQLRAIFGLGKQRDLEKNDLEALAAEVTLNRTCRLSKLTFDEANLMIVRLGGDAFPAPGHVATRTANHHRQKAGIKQVATGKQLRLMNELAAKRNMSSAGLASLCMRIIKRSAPITTAQTNKVVEALKSMNARDARMKEAA